MSLEERMSLTTSTTKPNNYERKNCRFVEKIFAAPRSLFPTGFWKECKGILAVSLPVMFVSISYYIMQATCVMFAGRLGVTVIAAVALATSFITVFGRAIYYGMNTAASTYLAQALGRGKINLLGTILQRGFAIYSLVTLIIWTILFNSEGIYLLCHQNPEVAKLATGILTIAAPGLFFHGMERLMRTFSLVVGHHAPVTVSTLVGLIISVGCNIILEKVFDTGVTGISVALLITLCCPFMVMIGFILLTRILNHAWYGWTWALFKDWGAFLTMAVNGCLMLCFELWTLEIAMIVSGMVGKVELAAQTIVFQLEMLIYSFTTGIQFGMSVRVGKALGESDPEQARTIHNVGMTMMLFMSTVTSVLTGTCHALLPRLFTADEEVIGLASIFLLLVTYYNFFRNIGCAVKGTLKGAGKQAVVAGVTFISNYLIGLPIGITLTFTTRLSTIGLWVGIAISMTLYSLFLCLYISKFFDYHQMCLEAKQRIQKTDFPKSDEPEESRLLNGNRSDFALLNKQERTSRSIVIGCIVGVFIVGIFLRIFLRFPLPILPSNISLTNDTFAINATHS